jgi:hypothetical protein
MINEAKVSARKRAGLPEGRSQRANELLDALILADYVLTVEPVAVLGPKGGKASLKRGPEYSRQIAAMRKARTSGRPKRENS